ncbi:thioredoxin domain-containing protein [Asticcacaulis endophyticus]|uniref:Thioredoxin-like fold domain-containing protein n=1 Tax=Asticcacaulis endophyticus TaxID=1395890 RepID=A0A918UVE6_9CAUL|nr:thioredoxin domain-containing protein [Asticcacaulis endophyticus]GGZ37098.1 hypothetical protein GCM10011273_24320 [Asticcacaulis endophyticus]
MIKLPAILSNAFKTKNAKGLALRCGLGLMAGFILMVPISIYAQNIAAQAELPEMYKGNPKAPVEVVQYASATCSHCAHWHNTVWPEFEIKYVKTGKVKFTFREVATQPANVAFGVYMVGRCAAAKPPAKMTASTAYFTVVDGFLKDQAKVAQSGDALTEIKALAALVGMDDAALDACLKDEALFQKVRGRMEKTMQANKVESTPTFFVNGVRLDGETELKDFDAAITAAQKPKKKSS